MRRDGLLVRLGCTPLRADRWLGASRPRPRGSWPWSRLSGCGAVLVDESAAGGASLDWFGQPNHSDLSASWCSLSERAVRPALVVMSHILLQQHPQLAFVPDDGAVQQLVTDATHPGHPSESGLRPDTGFVGGPGLRDIPGDLRFFISEGNTLWALAARRAPDSVHGPVPAEQSETDLRVGSDVVDDGGRPPSLNAIPASMSSPTTDSIH